MAYKGLLLQVTVGLLSLVAFLVVWLSPGKFSENRTQQVQQQREDSFLDDQVAQVKEKLSADDRVFVDDLERAMAKAGSDAEKTSLLDSITVFWDKQRRPAIAAIYAEKKAVLTNNAQHWNETGERFLNITVFMSDEDKPWAFDKARHAFEKTIELNPLHTDAQISLGVCIVNTSPENPMEGILMIREVVEKDSTNTRAILELGHFSITSRDFPKAIERFKQALRVDPGLHEALFYLGETYAQMGDLTNAEYYLQEYRRTQQDPEVQWQIDMRLKELREMSQKQ